MKKTPLKDTQNYTSNKSRKSFHAGQETEAAAKKSAMRSLTPKVPPQISELSLTSNSGTNDLLIHTVQKCDPELAKARAHMTRKNGGFLNVVHNRTEASQGKLVKQHGDIHYEAGFSSQDATASLLGYPSCKPSVTAFSKRTPGDVAASECLRLKVNTEPEVCRSADVQSNERLIRLQMLLRQLDESDLSDYIHGLLHLSPLELSRHAVELEKRSMQLSVEEVTSFIKPGGYDVQLWRSRGWKF